MLTHQNRTVLVRNAASQNLPIVAAIAAEVALAPSGTLQLKKVAWERRFYYGANAVFELLC